ncbi:MAG: xanthine dehydrogenase family protein molybdopterin-binding subunit [Acidobacteria bacterium]|nr:MAG: xanthine dehydrogenase family protein molybdopterin-binding subunit [Acidobacteriota bacterium]
MGERRYVGEAIPRVEDRRLVTGTSHYVDDIRLPGMLHVVLVRSPYGHAEIKRIETAKAETMPGVVAVLTGEALRGRIGSIPCASEMEGLKVPEHPVLAIGRVRYVGEPVVAVVAEDRYKAQDAADQVEVEYEPLDVVVDVERALEPGAPVIHEGMDNNVAFVLRFEGGEALKAAFEQADAVIEQRLINQRLHPVAMEPRGVLAEYWPGEDRLTVWSSTQIPHLLRTQLAAILGMAEHRVRVIAPEVGGGFGSKLNVYGEEALVAHLARELRKPVKWVETRRENMMSTIHGRGQINDVRVAVARDGRVLGLDVRILSDLGAYHQLLTPGIPPLTGLMLSGPYKIPAIGYEIVGVFTNAMSTDAYRGAGRPEATYLLERVMDLIARELKMDPVEVRMRNFPRPEEFPYETATGLVYDSGNYQAALQKALEVVGYEQLRREQAERRQRGELMGIGISSYVEICALGPSAALPAGGWESATVRVEPTGKVTVLTGASPHGQGQETSFAQLVADELGVALEDVYVVHGDTAVVPYGIGTFGSRATAVGGTAVYEAVQMVKEKVRSFAAHLLGVDWEDVEEGVGEYRSRREPERVVSFREVAQAAYLAKSLPPGVTPGLEATYFFEPSNFTFPFGTHVVVVEIDRETGEVKLKRYVAVDDCGRVINPLLVEGQIHGGIVQALGQALMEEVVYDEWGQLLSGDLSSYAVPRAADVPWMETVRTETPTTVNPMGIKGVGEAGTIGATPAIVNAVIDALSPLGVRHVDMPLTPEKIWRLLQGEAGSGG